MDDIWKTYEFHGDGMAIAELFQGEPFVFFLDSSLMNEDNGRFSFIGFDPFEVFSGKESKTFTNFRRFYISYKLDEWLCDTS